MNTLTKISSVMGCLFYAHVAFAATSTANMTNTATVSNSCSIAATGFTTTYDPVGENATLDQDVTATVTTTCTIEAVPLITLGQGSNPGLGSSDTTPIRRLNNAAYYLNYGLFSDVNRTILWGNTTGTAPALGISNGLPTVNTIYARITRGQTGIKAGAYTDTVVATVTF